MNLPARPNDASFMRLALRLARRAYGRTSPNPAVGAVLVKGGKIIGRGWHHQAGAPHAEIEALRNAAQHGVSVRGATLYVTLEPCSSHGRTPPCTSALLEAGIGRVVVAATDPNPAHVGNGYALLRRAGIRVTCGVMESPASRMNEAFNHWIVHRTPFVTVKAAMTLDGRIAAANGESKWITGPKARAYGMRFRLGADAILVGVKTVVADDPSLTLRGFSLKPLRRLILDSRARTPLGAKVVSDERADLTTIFVTREAPKRRVETLRRRVQVVIVPAVDGRVDLRWVLARLGSEALTSLLVEGGGEVNASFLLRGLAQRVAFFYAPKIMGGEGAPLGVAGGGIRHLNESIGLREVEWKKLGPDLLMTALLGR
jgi:diaminohydroxyphosphoribosylaminopyrimidine deaminase / 5-amino-6-(5-phosphoribosylamino)uracil reductase